MDTNNLGKVIEKELSYKIVGILFEVHTKLGDSYQEKYYQRAVEKLLIRDKIKYEKELKIDLTIDEEKIGIYFLDFLIEGRVVLELKAKYKLHPNDFKQVMAYLKRTGKELGILANFKGVKLDYKRILNSKICN